MGDSKTTDFLAATDMETKLGYWYDWFCSDKERAARTKRWGKLVQILYDKFGDRFENCELFWKQNPGWAGDYDTDTTLIQLYDDGYRPGSQRVCLSLSRWYRKVRGRRETHWKLELSVWKEGESFPDEPLVSASTLAELNKALKALPAGQKQPASKVSSGPLKPSFGL